MIFTGDVALPFSGAITCNLPNFLADKKWVLNLEGALVEDASSYLASNVVVNYLEAIKEITHKRDVVFALNNNHILDNGNFDETKKNIQSLEKEFFGAGINLDEASKTFFIKEDNEELLILSYGWEIVECPIANKNKSGVKPLSKKSILKDFKENRAKFPHNKIIVMLHWNYELEEFPMPAQRDLAKKLIEMGCDGIIGAHPHRVQGVEIFMDKPIVYSLGNWMFRQGVYRNGKLNFPDFCNIQLAFEYDTRGNHKCHFFNYDKVNHVVNYMRTEELRKSETIKKFTPFENLDSAEYLNWFKKNRYHKKFIPVYKYDDSILVENIKNYWNKLRTFGINFLVGVNLKK